MNIIKFADIYHVEKISLIKKCKKNSDKPGFLVQGQSHLTHYLISSMSIKIRLFILVW